MWEVRTGVHCGSHLVFLPHIQFLPLGVGRLLGIMSGTCCLVSLISYPLSRISCPNHRISCLVCRIACDIAPTSYLVSHTLYTTPCIGLIVPVHPISYILRRVPHRMPCIQNPTSHLVATNPHNVSHISYVTHSAGHRMTHHMAKTTCPTHVNSRYCKC